MPKDRYTLEESKCPYCDNVLSPTPKKKAKCKFCGNIFYVRTCPSDRVKVIVTEKGKEKIEEEWNIHSMINNVFSGGIISKEEFKKEKANANNIPDKDIIWGLFNKKLHSYMLKNAWSKMERIYYEMAIFLNGEGKHFFHLLQEARKCELRGYRSIGKVRILTARDDACEVCRQLEGKKLSVDEALKTMPIPVEDCQIDKTDTKKGFCKCIYITDLDVGGDLVR